MIDKTLFLRKPITPRERVELPELGPDAYVYVQGFGSKRLVQMAEEKPENLYSILAECLVDDAGNKLFDSDDDVKQHLDLCYPTVVHLADKAVELSGLTDTKKN